MTHAVHCSRVLQGVLSIAPRIRRGLQKRGCSACTHRPLISIPPRERGTATISSQSRSSLTSFNWTPHQAGKVASLRWVCRRTTGSFNYTPPDARIQQSFPAEWLLDIFKLQFHPDECGDFNSTLSWCRCWSDNFNRTPEAAGAQLEILAWYRRLRQHVSISPHTVGTAIR